MNLQSKFTRIEKSYKGNHRLRNLKVREVSLVPEPAILSDEESKTGSGWYVVKSAGGEQMIPEDIAKMFTLREGEELLAARERLANACRLKLVTETKDQQTFWMDPLMVYTDHVVMGYWWYLSLEDIRAQKPMYFKCYFSQSEDGEFTIDRVAPIQVSMSEVSAPADDDMEDDLEKATYEGIDFTPSERVQSQFAKGIELYEAGKGGDGLVASTIRWARRLAAGEAVTPAKARKGSAWFARHETDKKPDWDKAGEETPGYVAWLLWGGDAGRAWFDNLVERMDAADAKTEKSVNPAPAEVAENEPEQPVAAEVEQSAEVAPEPEPEVVPEAAPEAASEPSVEKSSSPETPESQPEVAQAPEAPAAAEESKPSQSELIKTLLASGAAFSIAADGTISVGQPTPPPPPAQADVAKNVEEVEDLKRDNAKLQDQLRKMKAQPVADLPPVSPAPIAKSADPPSHLDHMLALARRQTHTA